MSDIVNPMPADSPYQNFHDLGIERGSRVSFQAVDGVLYTGTVSNIDENEETGEINMTVDQYPDEYSAPGWSALAALTDDSATETECL